MERADLGLVEAVRMMRKIADKTQEEYARMVGISPRVLKDFELQPGADGAPEAVRSPDVRCAIQRA
jgi:hypothetical protein